MAVFSIAGCASVTKTDSDPNATPLPKTESTRDSKPDPKTGYAVDELADEAVANEKAFMGKEVVVTGYVSHH